MTLVAKRRHYFDQGMLVLNRNSRQKVQARFAVPFADVLLRGF